jgi:hypothetical protein
VQRSIPSATISGISAAALIKVTSCNGIRSALLKLGQIEDNYQFNRYRSDWLTEINKPTGNRRIAPAPVFVTLEIPRAEQDIEYPTDDDFSIRTASLIGLLRSGELKPSTVVTLSANFPVVRIEQITLALEDLGVDLAAISVPKNCVRAIGKLRQISTRLGEFAFAKAVETTQAKAVNGL